MLRVGHDDTGPWALISCDHGGCQAHVSARPGERLEDPAELVVATVDMAIAEGWIASSSEARIVWFCPTPWTVDAEDAADELEERIAEADGWPIDDARDDPRERGPFLPN